MADHIKKAISNGEQIEEIIISAKTTAEVKFNGHSIICSNMAPKDLGKCVQDYFKFQLEKTDNYEIKQINIVNKGLTEIQFKKYKNRIVEAFDNLFGLNSPDNYNNKNTPIKIKINPTIIET